MTEPQVTPVILCGGVGTRLWPLSRKSYPKQFAPLLGQDSLLEQTLRRVTGPGFTRPLVITGEPFRFTVTSLAGPSGATVLIEPEGRNTGPAALAAALVAAGEAPDAMLLIAHSDHLIPDDAAFRDTVLRGVPHAATGQIVTFGVTPTRAETGYGYLAIAPRATPNDTAHKVERFLEKPDAETAERLSTDGRHLWNAGLFLARADVLIEAFETHAPELMPPVRAAVDCAAADLGFCRLDPAAWARVPSIAIDYAVMERAGNIVAVPFTAGWADLGDWAAVWEAQGPDAAGLVTSGKATAIDCADSLLRSDSEEVELVGLGLSGILAVAMDDAVLIADKSRAQDVGQAVAALKSKGARQAEQFPKDYRPWGWYQTLALSDRFQVKRIVVSPGAALSLQSHVHRSEHWIVVAGTARVTIEDKVELLGENQSTYIPLGAKHRLENPGKVELVLIEVQTGSYLEEDDITRYEDDYDRS